MAKCQLYVPRGGSTRSRVYNDRDSDNQWVFQDQEVWMQAGQTTLWMNSRWAQRVHMVLDKVENVWQLKWPPVTHLNCVKLAAYKLSLQVATSACPTLSADTELARIARRDYLFCTVRSMM